MMKIICFILALLGCLGCAQQPVQQPPKPIILVTIPPYAHLVQALVQDQATIEIFVPPGANPHTYEPSPQQIQHFIQAKIWFRTGDSIEQKMVSFLKEHSVEIVNLSEKWTSSNSEKTHHHDEHDLHLWMNPVIVAEQIHQISAILCKQFPQLAPAIEKNRQQLMNHLTEVDRHITSQLKPLQGSHLLTSHPALGYFCKRYGLHQLSIEVEGKDPLPQDIATLMQKLKAHTVPVVLIEPQYSNKGALVIADQLHLPSESIDPYAENYFEMLEHLTELIVKYYDHPN